MLEAKNHKGFDVADWPLAGWSPPGGLRPDLSPPHHLVMQSTSQGVGCMHVQGHGRRTDSNDLDRFRMRPIGLRRSPYLGENSDAAVERGIGQKGGVRNAT